jgi:hypothetical protein
MLSKRLLIFTLLFTAIGLTRPVWDSTHQANAQTLQILAGDTFYGAATGAALATGTMGMKNDFENLKPLRFGVGLGTLAGLGIGAYDLSQSQGGGQLMVNGSFNQVNQTGLILLLDTFYGAGTGALVGSAITLMTGDPIVDGIRYGAGIGAWGGFAFGVADAFLLSNTSTTMASNKIPTTPKSAQGFVSFDSGNQWQVGLIQPSVTSVRTFSQGQIGSQVSASLQVLNVNINF